MSDRNTLESSISESVLTAVIDRSIDSAETYRPRLLYNDYEKRIKVGASIISELDNCDSFDFSVAFITMSGIAGLFKRFEDLKDSNVKGRIITTDYLNFNEPGALRWLLEHTDFDVRIYRTNPVIDESNSNVNREGFHTKGYIFHGNGADTIIIGSSNLTDDALSRNKEWNLRLSSMDNGELVKDTMAEFESMWNLSVPLTEEWIENYIPIYKRAKIERDREWVKRKGFPDIVPNDMQKEALVNLDSIRRAGKKRALLISATGTGKTFLSAFDVKQSGAKKVLFLIHREQVLSDAEKSFKKVLRGRHKYGILSGNSKDFDAEILFSTIQTMSKPNVMSRFSRDHFDYLICDEAHHSPSASYRSIIDYFQPDFMLGMTATPERMDGGDVFELFDHNIAYEIRLQEAMEQDMLCPFHYFGISDITVDGKVTNDESTFDMLTSEERVRHIIEKADYYSVSGDRVKGLIFCSNRKEGEALSEKINRKGLRTVFLSADTDQDERENAVKRLEMDSGDNALDYILTIDIFNEGVDIPSVNQIIMLRPTKSAIVFVQQLGRGLRKTDNKDYVIVIDFIGNYTNNFLIPIALSGDRSCNKDNIRRYLISGNNIIPGCSSIDFDAVSKERIYNCINGTNISKIKHLREEYRDMEIRLGRPPDLTDLYADGSLDPRVIVDTCKSLYDFKKGSKIETPEMSEKHVKMLRFVSKYFLNGKRPHELLILENVLEKGEISIDELVSEGLDKASIRSSISILTGGFLTTNSFKTYPYRNMIVEENGILRMSDTLSESLNDHVFLNYFKDTVKCGLTINKKEYREHDDRGFVLFSKYSRLDVCRILNWKNNEDSTVNGYRIKNNTCPVFVTYNKDESISETTKYEDKFIDRKTFSWISRSGVRSNNLEITQIMDSKNTGLPILLFVKKSDGEGSDFYYLGQVDPIESRSTKMGNRDAMNIKMRLRNTVREDLYEYLMTDPSISSGSSTN